MEDSLFVIKSVLSAEAPNEKLRILLDLCDGHQIFCRQPPNIISGVVSSINSRLNSKEKRPVGMVVLKIFLSQCSEFVFSENVAIWMDHCANDIPKEKAYDLLRIMFQMTSKLAVVPNAVLSKIIPKVFMKFCQQQGLSVCSLQCLEAVIMHFPKTCKPSLKDVGRVLARACDASDGLVARWAGRCVSCVGASAPGAWFDAWAALASGANDAVKALLAMGPCPRVFTAPVRDPPNALGKWLRLPPLPSASGEMRCAHALAKRFENLTLMMTAMLRCEGTQVKELCIEDLVLLALRALSVRPVCLHGFIVAPEEMSAGQEGGGGVAERAALAAALPLLHTHTFRLLTAFVDSCSAGLLKFGPVFCKMVLQTLKWSTVEGKNYRAKRPFAKVREAACVFLEHWCIRAQAASCVELFGDDLIDLLLAQVINKKKAIILSVAGQDLRPKMDDSADTLQGSTAREGESAAAAAALGTMAALVQASGSLLGPRIHSRVQAACVALELRLRRAGGDEAVPPPPLASAAVRANLHRLLLALALHPGPRWPAPVPYALRLPADARQDPHPQVRSSAALAAAASAQALLHPLRSRCLRFPLEEEDLREAAGLPSAPATKAADSAPAVAAPAVTAPAPPGKRALKRKRQRDMADSKSREEIVNGCEAAEDEPREKKRKKKKKKQQQLQQLEDTRKPAMPSPDTLSKKKQRQAPMDSPSLPITPSEVRRRSTSRASRPRTSAGGDWAVEDRVLPSPHHSPNKTKLPSEALSTSSPKKIPDKGLHEIEGEVQNIGTQAQQSPVVQPGSRSPSPSSLSSQSLPPLHPLHSQQPIVELSPPVARAAPTSVVIEEMVDEQILCSGQGDESEWQAPLVDLVDTDTDNSMSVKDVGASGVRDVVKEAESEVGKTEAEVVDLEDTAVEEELEVMDVEDKAVEVKDKTVDVEDKMVDVEDKTVDVKDKTVDVKDKTVDVEPKTVDVEDKTIDVEDEVVDLEDEVVDLEDKAVDMQTNVSEDVIVEASAPKQMEEKKTEKKQEGGAEGESREATRPQGTDNSESKDETPTTQEDDDDEADMLSAFVDVVASDAANQ